MSVDSIRPPKKSWKRICNLSGGEKTLSSLAFVFALHTFRPTPIYVMDEIDAALDFKNVSIVGRFIKERTKNVNKSSSLEREYESFSLNFGYSRHNLLLFRYVKICLL